MKKDRKPTPAEIRRVFAEMGRRGGSSKSAAKAAAVRENGKKGGRPRKRSPDPQSYFFLRSVSCMEDEWHYEARAFLHCTNNGIYGCVAIGRATNTKTGEACFVAADIYRDDSDDIVFDKLFSTTSKHRIPKPPEECAKIWESKAM